VAIKWGGFSPHVINKTTPEQILELGKSIDDDLAIGKRTLADLTKAEKQALGFYYGDSPQKP
jgi:hypothetical protein